MTFYTFIHNVEDINIVICTYCPFIRQDVLNNSPREIETFRTRCNDVDLVLAASKSKEILFKRQSKAPAIKLIVIEN